MEIRNRWSKTIAIGFVLTASLSIRAQVNVTTWHNDLPRTGVNPQETILTTANVNTNSFGRLYSIPVDGQVYAQPLFLSGVSIGGGTTVNSATDLNNCGDLQPEVGITGTPVIDPASTTLYVVAKSKVNGNIVQHRHALSTLTLAEKFGSPVQIQASVPGAAKDGSGTRVTFNPTWENQRPGLALAHGRGRQCRPGIRGGRITQIRGNAGT
jgi:hypothetical protein